MEAFIGGLPAVALNPSQVAAGETLDIPSVGLLLPFLLSSLSEIVYLQMTFIHTGKPPRLRSQ
jgi:hypothetical protein